MRRLILSAVAASMLAASVFSGQAAPLVQPSAPQSSYTKVDWQKPGRHVEKRVVKKKVVEAQPLAQRPEILELEAPSGGARLEPPLSAPSGSRPAMDPRRQRLPAGQRRLRHHLRRDRRALIRQRAEHREGGPPGRLLFVCEKRVR